MHLRGIAGIRLGLQLGLRRFQFDLRILNLAVQGVDFRLKAVRIGLLQISNILFIARALFHQTIPLGDGLGALRLQFLAALPVFQRLQLLLQRFLAGAQIAQLRLQLTQQRLLLIGQIGQAFQLFDGRIDFIQLGLKLSPLSGQLFDGLGELQFSIFQLRKRGVQLRKRALFGACQLALAVRDLRLRVVELLLRIGQFLVDVPQNRVIQHIDAVLLNGDVHLLGNHAGCRDGRDAVNGLVLRNQRLLHVF